MKIVKSWKPLTICAKSFIVDVQLDSQYTSVVRIIRNETKCEDTKEHFISEGLLNICKLYIFRLNTTVHLQIPAVEKQPFPLLFGLFKGFLSISNKFSVIKSFLKNPGEINLKHIALFKGS